MLSEHNNSNSSGKWKAKWTLTRATHQPGTVQNPRRVPVRKDHTGSSAKPQHRAAPSFKTNAHNWGTQYNIFPFSSRLYYLYGLENSFES